MIVRFDTEKEASDRFKLLYVQAQEDVRKGELRACDIIKCERRLIVFRQKFHTFYYLGHEGEFPCIHAKICPHGSIEDLQTLWKMQRIFEEV